MKKGAFTRRWFKEIPDFPGYWINKKGRVFSTKTNRFIAYNRNMKGYPRVEIRGRDGNRAQKFVHRLVAIVFVPNPDPVNKIEVNHLDYNPSNFINTNLRWDTPEENYEHSMQRRSIEKFSRDFLAELICEDVAIDYNSDTPPF